MFMRGRERVSRDALLGAIRRAINFSGFAESDLISWLGTHPMSRSVEDFAHGFFSDLLRARISFHTQIGLHLSIPAHQKIDAETETQFLGLAGLIITASTVMSLTGRISADFIPSPDYFHPSGLSPYWKKIRCQSRYYFIALRRGEWVAGHYQAVDSCGNAHLLLGRT